LNAAFWHYFSFSFISLKYKAHIDQLTAGLHSAAAPAAAAEWLLTAMMVML